MPNLDEIIASFASDADATALDPVVGSPPDNDIKRIRRNVVDLLQIFHYHKSQDSLSGLIDMEASYLEWFGRHE